MPAAEPPEFRRRAWSRPIGGGNRSRSPSTVVATAEGRLVVRSLHRASGLVVHRSAAGGQVLRMDPVAASPGNHPRGEGWPLFAESPDQLGALAPLIR